MNGGMQELILKAEGKSQQKFAQVFMEEKNGPQTALKEYLENNKEIVQKYQENTENILQKKLQTDKEKFYQNEEQNAQNLLNQL